MTYGILTDQRCRKLFNEINDGKFCSQCRINRKEYKTYDQKHNNIYSNLIPGFSSEQVSIPIDILIVAESHGGGDGKLFRSQKNLNTEVQEIGNYYLIDNLKTFHQQEMRNLIKKLDKNGNSWVFTDLVKCYVKKKKGNFKLASVSCKQYLNDQIQILKPRVILALGHNVNNLYFSIKSNKGRVEHGTSYTWPFKNSDIRVIWSYFPSQNTANKWVEYGGWEKVMREIKKELR